MLSGRWQESSNDGAIQVFIQRPDAPFYYVLNYLRFGVVPIKEEKQSFLSKAQLQALKEEAQFYLLPKLEAICNRLLMIPSIPILKSKSATTYTTTMTTTTRIPTTCTL